MQNAESMMNLIQRGGETGQLSAGQNWTKQKLFGRDVLKNCGVK